MTFAHLLFTNYFFGIQNMADAQGGNNIYGPTREWHWSFEAGSCICHGQQTGMGQTYKISAGAPEIDR